MFHIINVQESRVVSPVLVFKQLPIFNEVSFSLLRTGTLLLTVSKTS